MIITRLEELSKARSKVYLDDEFAFVLYKGELRIYKIKVGNELSKEFYEEIFYKVLVKRAKLRCMNLLKAREYTEHQMRDKLKQGFYTEYAIEEAISYVKAYHYIDDLRYTVQFVEYNLATKSKKRMQLDLFQKGIAKETIAEVFMELGEENQLENEVELVKQLLKKKHYNMENATIQEKQKMYGFLFRKGFSMDVIRKAIQFEEE